MKKIILWILLIVPAISINAQSLDAEQQYIDSLSKSEKPSDQVALIRKKWNAFIANYNYPELTVNKIAGEIDISEILIFTNLDKQTIFQRCLQWIAINYGDLIYNNPESGKIIANGLINLTHHGEYKIGFGGKEIRPMETPTNYTLILTIKDNKIKYNVTNITFTFTSGPDDSGIVSETTLPVFSLYPIVAKDQLQWVSYTTLLNECKNKFYLKLKSSLVEYVNDVENDYSF